MSPDPSSLPPPLERYAPIRLFSILSSVSSPSAEYAFAANSETQVPVVYGNGLELQCAGPHRVKNNSLGGKEILNFKIRHLA